MWLFLENRFKMLRMSDIFHVISKDLHIPLKRKAAILRFSLSDFLYLLLSLSRLLFCIFKELVHLWPKSSVTISLL